MLISVAFQMPLPLYSTSEVNSSQPSVWAQCTLDLVPLQLLIFSSSEPVTWALHSQQADPCRFLFATAISCPGTLCQVVKHCLHNPLILSPRVLRAPPYLVCPLGIVVQCISAVSICPSNRLRLKSMTEGENVESSSPGGDNSIPEAPIGQEVMKACIEITDQYWSGLIEKINTILKLQEGIPRDNETIFCSALAIYCQGPWWIWVTSRTRC